MSTNKQDRAKQNLLKQIEQLSKIKLKQQIQWLLRCWIVSWQQQSQAGFVLPTVVLVLLVVGLTVAALLFRALSQTNQVIGKREQQQIYNAATPAIDRAKAKLEYLFTNGKIPGGIPPESRLAELMNDAAYDFPGKTTTPYNQNEIRLNLDGNSATKENAWVYQDANGNTIAYSILMKTEDKTVTPNISVNTADSATKANSLVVRSGPVSTVQPSSSCTSAGAGALEQGWFKDSASTAFLRKNFQVNAVVLKNGAASQTATTLEFQQERQVDRGNKWGAWFLNDLEIFPGPAFNWNGALHTEGSVMLGQTTSSTFKAYLISAPASCLYGTNGLDASEISMNQVADPNTGTVLFQGQIVSGSMKDNTFATTGGSIDRSPTQTDTLGSASDSVNENAVTPSKTPSDIAIDALSLLTGSHSYSARRASDPANTTARDPNWDSTNPLAQGATQRVFNKQVPRPYVDDTYRADNRYGPKFPPETEQNPNGLLPSTPKKEVGAVIASGDNIFDNAKEGSTYANLVSNNPIASNDDNVGLDGYWERRTRNKGLRIIVGQRLELGNPLAVPNIAVAETRPHEALQRITLRDNLAAVQATAIYFHENDAGDVPVACLSTTVHPGTAATLRRSSTFEKIIYSTNASGGTTDSKIFNDFFTGNGTNGWEYQFKTGTPSTAQLKALNNLAYFAGDPDGAFPPKQEISTSTIVHPYPPLTRNGNFSNLRRALTSINAGGTYAALSIADKSYIDTASCALGMIADQIKTLEAYNYTFNSGAAASQQLDDLSAVLTGTYTSPQAAIASVTDPKLSQLARLVYLKEQVAWDRLAPTAANPGCNIGTANLNKLCPTARTIDSALYYIFPLADHAESRITDTYIALATVNSLTSFPTLYKSISTTELDAISFTPRTTPTTGTGNLDNIDVTSTTDTVNGGTYGANTNVPNHSRFGLIRYIDRYIATPVNSVYRIPFKDTALFNGREMMNVRVLNIDLDLLRTTKPSTVDTWLPISGLIYGFREDAVREDAIARPTLGTWAAYKSVWDANTASGPPSTATGTPSQIWRMNAVVTPKDPPVNGLTATGTIATGGTGISPKPIDYYPDPERRPYGFRLKQGADLTRTSADNTYGLSFISDNPAYIQGDFNLHQNSSGTRLEEFTQLLTYAASGYYNNFYTRTTINTEFAKAADLWRPTEILADAITILSDNFCDGSVEDGLPTTSTLPSTVDRVRYGCGAGTIATSYLNQNRATNNTAAWLRENPADNNSPVAINNNGYPLTGTAFPGTAYASTYQAFSTGKSTNGTVDTRVNAILVSGLVPSRAQQAYGGLHNFPRFLEGWGNLFISGSFIQLNFSTYATAPFDQDAWERTDNSGTNENIGYYGAPARRWGYDVGLQYQAPGSVSRRFTSLSATRSEFYRELPVDDPYIKKLRCAFKGTTTNRVDPNLTATTCP